MTAASMVKERQSLETGNLASPTILMDNSTVWSLSVGVTMAHGETLSALPHDTLCATTVSGGPYRYSMLHFWKNLATFMYLLCEVDMINILSH